MDKFKRFIYIVLLLCFSLFFSITPTYAEEDHAVRYKTDYYVVRDGNKIRTRVTNRIEITNLKTEVYVKKFTISFPDTFAISNVAASDGKDLIVPQITTTGGNINIVLEFSDPEIGKNSVNTFKLDFDQDNLFKLNGSVWEVILPTIESVDNAYEINVHLPAGDTKISVAKPIPDDIVPDESNPGGRKIIWKNPKTRIIYAIFGDKQFYKTNLRYSLRNPRLTPIYTDIALPPDTNIQKIYIESLDPKPSSVHQDEDGNYLARYYLGPKETKVVMFRGIIELDSKMRDEVVLADRSISSKYKNLLLTPKTYWNLSRPETYQNLHTPEDIYRYVVNTLKYDFGRSASNNTRYGAEKITSMPDKAVCVEFSDLFIAIAREKGILAREIQGFGFASDARLRPLSLLSDVLHSWPQFFDGSKWISVDPTWENTSGIDYFSSFDLNHISFAIHGVTPDYPLPAGMYKTENSKDITIEPVEVTPTELQSVLVALDPQPKEISDKETYETKIRVENKGNTYMWNIPVSLQSDSLTFSSYPTIITSLAPFEVREIPLKITTSVKNKQTQAALTITAANEQSAYTVAIIPYYYRIIFVLAGIVVVLTLVFVAIRIIKKKNEHYI